MVPRGQPRGRKTASAWAQSSLETLSGARSSEQLTSLRNIQPNPSDRPRLVQVWVLLLELVNSVSNGSIKAKREVLEFLFEMNYSEPGAGYKISDLKDGPVAAMEALVALGLVYKPSRQSDTFFPTKVGRRLVANTGSGGRTDEKNVSASLGTCEIIVETNFRLYAYTTSKLQVDLISMFVHMRTRLPNLAVGHITNESVRMALRNGISAEQIIAYLNAHASSRCRSGRIPSNVSQMIRLWEAEKDRVKTKSGVLFDKFETEEAFDMVEKYAFEMDAKLWSSRILKTLVVADRAADQVKTFIKSNRIA
uniref:General transcription factor IIH subunit 4 n=1 Tax=Rhodosorus marinus TaxID=101924 RepID=A0A7S3AAD8_9RHOD|mmetsp:Transcript_9046/g.39849  ORF Transcript_9046/g.39849 Transcript_9046/m.39849 type:complete len:308 (+) Transcript_9046:788-1711(+)